MNRPPVLRVRLEAPGEVEERLGAALERALAGGVTKLDALCDAVNAQGALDDQGREWSPASLLAFLERLP